MSENKKVEYGEKCCMIDDCEQGCSPYGIADFPAEALNYNVSCKYQDHSYTAIKCLHCGNCDFARFVDEHDIEEYPDLFCYPDNYEELYG